MLRFAISDREFSVASGSHPRLNFEVAGSRPLKLRYEVEKPSVCEAAFGGADGARTRDLRRDRPAF